jgi:uncharacterized protein (TIGR00255 family)
MIHSMTGYATAAKEFPFGALNLELRSVNHRYLDLQFRLSDDLRAVEPALRELVVARVSRGKLECRATFAANPSAPKMLKLNEPVLQQLSALELKVCALLAGAGHLTAADALRWPGVLAAEPLPLEELHSACRDLLATALDEFAAARAREGDKIKALLLERAAAAERIVSEVAPRIPQAVSAFQEKLTARLKEALGGGDEERIRQEVALFANKVDVDEELSRLTTHVAELKRVLAEGGAVGKRLDFLMQELNREANTLGSKSADIAVSQAALELKLLIEQMREQIQNIE